MEDDLNKFDEVLKKMPKEERDIKLLKILKQEEKSREKSRIAARTKKEANIKSYSIDLAEEDINKFKNLMRKTKYSKTELFLDMLRLYNESLNKQ